MYAPWLDLLCKFFFLASALHQAVFCLLSSLPYAIGQVQVRPAGWPCQVPVWAQGAVWRPCCEQ